MISGTLPTISGLVDHHWLDKVVLLVLCYVVGIYCMQSSMLYLVSCRTLGFLQFHIDPHPAGTVPEPAAKPAPKATKPSAKPAAKPAAGEPISVALVEHVQLFKVKYSCQKKWCTVPVSQ